VTGNKNSKTACFFLLTPATLRGAILAKIIGSGKPPVNNYLSWIDFSYLFVTGL